MKRGPRDIEVGELMSRKVRSVTESDSLALVHQLMLWGGIRHLPVLRDGALVGLISDRDLLRYEHVELLSLHARDMMTSPVETVAVDAPVSEASARMAIGRIDCLPVVDDLGEMVGLLTSTDILAERGRLAHKDETPRLPTAAALAHPHVFTVYPDDTLEEAVALMVAHGVRHLPVIDRDRRVVGMLSDRDVRARVGHPREALEDGDRPDLQVPVEEVMTLEPMQVSATASLYDIADVFLDERIGAVPVIDEHERLVGLISYVDVIAFLTQPATDNAPLDRPAFSEPVLIRR